MTPTPDEDYDVMLRECEGTWEIWVGDELHGLRYTLEAALRRARDVAAELNRPAWLLDETGRPMKPIEPDTLQPALPAKARLPKKAKKLAEAQPERVRKRQKQTG